MSQHDDLRDRLIDCALSEVAGGHAPPDLSARIMTAVEDSVTPTEEIEMDSPKRTRRVWISLAVAACLLIGAGFLIPAMLRARESARRAESHAQARALLEQGITGANLPSPYYLSDDVQYPEGDAPVAYPSAEQWKDVTERRKKFGDDGLTTLNASALNRLAEPAEASRVQQIVTGKNQSSNPTPSWHNGTSFGVELNVGSGSEQGRGQADQFATLGGIQLDERNFDAHSFHDKRTENLFALDPKSKTPEGQGSSLPGDQYTRIYENPFIEARGAQAVSTFSIDVDTASYANVRQFLQSGQLPPPDAVRLEELINYFDYQYEAPASDSQTPFSAAMEVAGCPWEPKHRLVRIALQGRKLENNKRPKSNLVFLIDVSGSMDEPNKLPLVVEGMKQLVRELGENDRVAIVVYASSEGLVLPSTPGTEQSTILEALDRLQAGGSTAGGAGIQLAYQMAEDHFVQGGVNRVILCTDGDFNVGVTSTADLERMVEQKAKDTKVFLSVLGFGRGNLNDAMMEAISNHGNGNYHYVDNLTEARKVLVEEMTGTLVTIAKDVKIQVEFNPAQVAGYRLLGYENRMLRTEDFNDDKKDAGEIGAGHRVTALYEIVPAGEKVEVPSVDDLKYQQPAKANEATDSKELLTLKLRYKQPDGDTSTKIEFPMTDEGKAFSAATDDFKFATAVASFGMLLRNSEHKGNATYDAVLEIATEGAKHDPNGYRAEFLELVRKAKEL